MLMNEHSLHSEIKNGYSLPGDKLEVKVDDFIVDIVRNGFLIEIETRNFSAIKKNHCKTVWLLHKNHKMLIRNLIF